MCIHCILLRFFPSISEEWREKDEDLYSHLQYICECVYCFSCTCVCMHVYYSSDSFPTNLLNSYKMVTCFVARRYQELFWLYTVGQTWSSAPGQVPVSLRSSTDQPAPRVYCPHSLTSHLKGLTCKYLRLNPF